MNSAGQLQKYRRVFPGWRVTAPLGLFELLERLERQLLPFARARTWEGAESVVRGAVSAAIEQYPDFSVDLFAHGLDWLARIKESVGDPREAVEYLAARLRLRYPRDPWRGRHYVALVELLTKERRYDEALFYSERGAKYCRISRESQTAAELSSLSLRIRDLLTQDRG